MKKILIVEDDPAIAKIESDFLKAHGYEVVAVEDGIEGKQEALSGVYDLVLLDLMLPGMDGIEVCRQVRDEIDIPILMVTAKSDDVDKIMGLGFGADDYISKPFSPTELVARVKANLAQYERMASKAQTGQSDEIVSGRIRLNTKSHRVFVGDEEVEFKNKEYELLHFLIIHPEMVFTREHLYEAIWGQDSFGDSRTVSVHVNRIRMKVESDPADPQHIQTVWGAGYRYMP